MKALERLGDDPRLNNALRVRLAYTMAAAHLQLIELHPNVSDVVQLLAVARDRLEWLIRQALRAGEVDLSTLGPNRFRYPFANAIERSTYPDFTADELNQPGIREFLIGSRSTAALAWIGVVVVANRVGVLNNVLRDDTLTADELEDWGVDASAPRAAYNMACACCAGRDQFFVGDVLPLVLPSPIAVTGTLNRNLSAALHFLRLAAQNPEHRKWARLDPSLHVLITEASLTAEINEVLPLPDEPEEEETEPTRIEVALVSSFGD